MIKRFRVQEDLVFNMVEDKEGQWVRYEDIKELLASASDNRAKDAPPINPIPPKRCSCGGELIIADIDYQCTKCKEYQLGSTMDA